MERTKAKKTPMTPKEYRARIEALGFNANQWVKFVGIDRTTHFRHLKGERRIPKTLINVVEWLDRGELANPNSSQMSQ